MDIHLMEIYGLIDPRTDCLRYVGKSVNAMARYKNSHCVSQPRSERGLRAHWIRSLLKRGLYPGVVILETVSGDGNDAERFWIASLRAAGAQLLNMTDGGDGGALVGEAKTKMIRSLTGRKLSPEHAKKSGDFHRGRKRSAATVAKLKIALKKARAANWTPQARAKMSAAKKGKTWAEIRKKDRAL